MHTSPCLVFKEVYCSRLRSAPRFIICRHSFVSHNQWKEKFFFGNVRQGKHSFGQKFKKLTLSIKCTFEKYWLQQSKSTSGELDQWTRGPAWSDQVDQRWRWTSGPRHSRAFLALPHASMCSGKVAWSLLYN